MYKKHDAFWQCHMIFACFHTKLRVKVPNQFAQAGAQKLLQLAKRNVPAAWRLPVVLRSAVLIGQLKPKVWPLYLFAYGPGTPRKATVW